jgi:thiol-disulfide isomerase/thioredoxin
MAMTPGTLAWAGEFSDDVYFPNRPASLVAMEGKTAPELKLDAWVGDETSLQKEAGNVVVIDFWATWCPPCMAAIPKNVKMVDTYRDQGLRFIGVHDSKNGWNKVDQVVKDKKINYPVARDKNGQSTKDWSIGFWPTYFVVDRKGVIRAAGLRPDKVEEVVKALLKEPGGPAMTAPAGEFPNDWFVGGAHRLPALFALEGQPAPPVTAASDDEWIGNMDLTANRDGKVTVVRFIAPGNTATMEGLSDWKTLTDSMAPHGVVFLGVCDYYCDWKQMQELIGDQPPPFPIARDQAPEAGQLPLGRTATAYGVLMWPTTVVIDRNGRVRAAGLREQHLQAVIEKLMSEPIQAAPEALTNE